MIDHADPTLFGKLKEGFASLVFFGMTQQHIMDTKSVVNSVIVGVLAALAVSYINAEKNAAKLDGFIAQQTAAMLELKADIRVHNADVRVLAIRQAELEATVRAMHQSVPHSMSGMSGMAGKVPK